LSPCIDAKLSVAPQSIHGFALPQQRFIKNICKLSEASRSTAPQTQLVRDLFKTYDKKVKPTVGPAEPVNVTFSMNLYQIVEINEPQQYVLISVWIIERWDDRMLWWDPLNYSGTIEVHLPCENVWLPDTTLYNSLVMKDEDSRRLQNVVIRTRPSEQVAHIEMLYPAIYKFSCKLNLEFFPFDIQVCTMVFSSWTFDKTGIDYFAYANSVGTSNYIENEGWHIIKTTMERIEREFECCPIPYSLLEIKLHLRRKPLFYVVNLVIPTSIITLIALVGFFTTSSASGIRDEKVSLGINTLLSMSILMLMVSGQMPTTSTSIPLIPIPKLADWFYLGMIVIISVGTLASSIVINVHKRGQLGKRLTQPTISIIKCLSFLSMTTVPYHLQIHSKLFCSEASSRTNTHELVEEGRKCGKTTT
uniref:Neur_chan_LBD domain-containing protein n=1 Tax=Toxocara canis TaxID=6265 RepID=A0A183TVV7_TOXCA